MYHWLLRAAVLPVACAQSSARYWWISGIGLSSFLTEVKRAAPAFLDGEVARIYGFWHLAKAKLFYRQQKPVRIVTGEIHRKSPAPQPQNRPGFEAFLARGLCARRVRG